MNPKQISTIFGPRTSIPPPQAGQHQQRTDMDLDGLVAAIRQGKSVSDFPQYAKTLAPLRTLLAMNYEQREGFRKTLHNG